MTNSQTSFSKHEKETIHIAILLDSSLVSEKFACQKLKLLKCKCIKPDAWNAFSTVFDSENGLQCKNTARFESYRDSTQGLISLALVYCFLSVLNFSFKLSVLLASRREKNYLTRKFTEYRQF